MNRRNLLRGLGAIGLGSVLPASKTLRAAAMSSNAVPLSCLLTPQETEGPYYFNPNLVRQDIRPDLMTGVVKTGVPLHMTIAVVNADCVPIPNVLVDIWHNDKDGVYSGYAGQPGGVNTIGQTFLRGIQMADANGRCSFTSIYPGWYPGRVTHVHFKVRLSSTTYVTSQFAFPDSVNTTVYNTSLYIAKGQNSVTNASDNIFRSANPEGQVMNVTPNANTGGYDGAYTIGINFPTEVKESRVMPEEFALYQNHPNPFNPATTIKYHLPSNSNVKLEVYDILGHEVAILVDDRQAAGTYTLRFDASKLESGFYLYKLNAGSFVQMKEMLLIK